MLRNWTTDEFEFEACRGHGTDGITPQRVLGLANHIRLLPPFSMSAVVRSTTPLLPFFVGWCLVKLEENFTCTYCSNDYEVLPNCS